MKKVERLKAGLHMLDAPPANKHTIFLDSTKDAREFDPAKHFDTVPELASRTFNRPRVATLESEPVVGAANRRQLRKALKQRDSAYQVSISCAWCIRTLCANDSRRWAITDGLAQQLAECCVRQVTQA